MRGFGLFLFIIGLLLLLFIPILGVLLAILGVLMLMLAKSDTPAGQPISEQTQRRLDSEKALATGRTRHQVEDERLAQARKPCPYCAEAVLPAAVVCPFCKSPLHEGWANGKPRPPEPFQLTERVP